MERSESELREEWESKYDYVTGKLRERLSDECYKWRFGNDFDVKKENKEVLGRCYEDILMILENYMEMPEDHRKLIAIWIIGTYYHEKFNTYPFLFINAMRGSGKTRLLKIISHLSKGGRGQVHTGIREAILYRMAKGQTLVLDELEGIGSKESGELREYLNASYKKGGVVQRMKKIKDEWVIENFEPFKPIAMANIWGMDEVLGDRCISFVLEKSNNPIKTKKTEDFDSNPIFKRLNELLSVVCVNNDDVVSLEHKETAWNEYINEVYSYNTTYNTYNTYNTYTTLDIEKKKSMSLTKKVDLEEMFTKIDKLDIDGRNLELLLPLIFVSKSISSDLFEDFLKIGKEIMERKKEDETTESKDVVIYEFIASRQEGLGYVRMRDLVSEFKVWFGEDDWINEKSFGRALKRLNLLFDKRRMASGIQVMLNVGKAKEQLKIFRKGKKDEK